MRSYSAIKPVCKLACQRNLKKNGNALMCIEILAVDSFNVCLLKEK